MSESVRNCHEITFRQIILNLSLQPVSTCIVPWNIREEFGKGRVRVHAEFDGVPYDGSID